MKHAEVVIARRAVEEGRGLVVVVNKMDLLKGKVHENVVQAVPEEVQTVLPQVLFQILKLMFCSFSSISYLKSSYNWHVLVIYLLCDPTKNSYQL